MQGIDDEISRNFGVYSYVCQDNYTNQVHPYHENMIAYMDHVKQLGH